MALDRLYPIAQKHNLLQAVQLQITDEAEEQDVTQDRAFIHVALDVLGYDYEPAAISDGRGDFGIDFIDIEEGRASIFQFKSQSFTDEIRTDFKVTPEHLTDLARIHRILSDIDDLPREANAKVQHALKELRASIDRYYKVPENKNNPYNIDIFFVMMAGGFTPQAEEEFNSLEKDNRIDWGRSRILLSYMPVMLDELLADKWRETNADWRTSEGKKDDSFTLHVSGEMIESPKSLVFFAKAGDLVRAFDTYGYQIFEPNVRCELKRSKVNEAIRASIKSSRGRREFKHLNNGITVICAGFNKKKDGMEIRVRQPGVINGLQTVKAIHDSYDELSAADREHFESTCDILVRLHTRDAVGDYKELVKSTNNQNPMQARNLRSNSQEQIEYERLFADIGWFYERKEGAWQAYRSDHSLWGSLKGYKSEDFKSPLGSVRNVDNLDLSQSWISFLGFSDQAIHNKREIFSDDRYYDLIFRKRIAKSGFDYDFKLLDPAVREEAEDQAPSQYMLLTAYLLYKIADVLTPSRRQNREEAVRRLKLDKVKKEEQDAKLAEDNVYTKGLVLAGAKYLFPEFCGLLLFRSVGNKFHNIGPKLASTKSLKPILKERDFDPLLTTVKAEEFESTDFVSISWALYNFCLEQIIGLSSWRQQFQQAAVRSRFNYSEFNRVELFKQLESLDTVYRKRAFPKPWSQGFEEANGIFAHYRAILS